MRIGFSLPLHGRAANPEGLITIAKRAEALGYESLWVWERLLAVIDPKSPYPLGDGTHPALFRSVLDPLDVLTFVAGHTERVALGTSILVFPLYNPLVLARQLTTLDILSKGRLRVGLGTGWNRDEIETSGVSFTERGRWTTEALQLLKAIWTTDPVEFKGKYFQVPRSFIGPKPVQKPHPPIFLAAYAPAAMKRIAEQADGWNLVGFPLAAVKEMFETIQGMASAAGRDPKELQVIVRANVAFSEKPLAGDRMDFHGTLQQIGEDVAKAREVGVHELFFDLWTAHPDVDTVDDWLKGMETLYEVAKQAR